MHARLRQLREDWKSWLPELLAILGGLTYFLQSRIYALTQLSVLDEGAYLLKGYWFASGKYIPYQEFGPFTNHMPLAFLIPGAIQAWFGPGLLVGRIFAVVLGLLFLLGLWLLSRRLAGPWWAAAAVWAVALNPAVIKMYSVGVSQGLIAAMLIWALYFSLGDERPLWQILLGAGLAALMALTRLNMTPVLFGLLLYLFWERGRRSGLWAAALGIGVWVLGHALFWPGILQMWANYTPALLTPFLDAWRIPPEAVASWTSGASLHGRWLSFLEGLRFNFLPIAAALGAWLLWPARKAWRDPSERRLAVFLSSLFVLLFLIHAAASLGTDYCVFCFPLYVAFFNSLGLLLFLVVWPNRFPDGGRGRQRTARALLVLLPAAVAYGATQLFGNAFPPRQWVRALLTTDVPRVENLSFQGGSLPLWGLLENALGWDYAESFRALQNGLGYGLMTVFGLLTGLGLLWLARRESLSPWKHVDFQPRGSVGRAVLLMLAAGLLFSPSPLLGGGYRTYDCNENVIAAYEGLGAELERRIPAGALVFWRGGRSAIPLLYLPDVEIYPTQLNGDYTYRLGGSAELLEHYNLWGPAVLENWLQEADIILVEQDLYRTWLKDALESGPYALIGSTEPLSACSPRSQILMFVYRP